MKKVELLLPAGNIEKLRFAIAYGADAVYMGCPGLSLRAAAEKYDFDTIEAAKMHCKEKDKKLYIALNIFAYNDDFKHVEDSVGKLKDIGVDGLIVSDPGIMEAAKRFWPDARIHLSTQANTTNLNSVDFWASQGTSRVCLARELSLGDVANICSKSNIEIEVFVHGAMCLSYSGRCYLSKYMAGREANKGDCAHNCRWEYSLVERNRPDENFDIGEDARGAYILNSRDLNLSKRLPELIDAGVSSFKIEGRMKSIHYISVVASVYRQIIDSYAQDKDGFKYKDEWKRLLESVSHRHYTESFLSGNGQPSEYSESSRYIKNYHFAGVVDALAGKDENKNMYKVGVRNRLQKGEYEFFSPGGRTVKTDIDYIFDLKREKISEEAHANDEVLIKSDTELEPMTIIRKSVKIHKPGL